MRKRASYIYREIFRNAADGIVVINQRAQIIDANDTYLAMTDYSLKELLGMTVFDLRVDSPERTMNEMAEAKRIGHLKVEGYIRRKDGSMLSVDASISYIRSAGGIFYALVRDVTDRNKLDKIREEYAALIAHDLRDPLTSITIRAEQLKARVKTETEKKSTLGIIRSSRRITEMINEIVETAKQESIGLNSTDKHPIVLNRVVAQIITNDIPGDDQRRIRFFNSDHDLTILGEKNGLRRIFTNLITNALKYSSQGKPVDIYLKKKDGLAIVKVHDSGEGIPPEDLPHVFEKFYRAKKTRSKYGFGLGLYITKLLVDTHKGEIKVESQLGQGATFSVLFPLLKTE